MTEKKNTFKKEKNDFILYLSGFRRLIDSGLKQLENEKIVNRIWQHDYTVWKSNPTEISNRLGWLHTPETIMNTIEEIQTFAEEINAEGFTQALLLGMGGSSLASEVLRSVFGVKTGYPDLHVLDSTNPGAVQHVDGMIDPEKTLFIVSTKSGSTAETLSFMRYFYNKTMQMVGEQKVGSHFIAITDPKSKLESPAQQLGFRKVFLNDPNIGGRYSALSYFGLVPAGLIGTDLKKMLYTAQSMADNAKIDYSLSELNNTSAILGTVMGMLARQGQDKLTFITSPEIQSFGTWVEQLVAESTGKEGKGILPVVNETVLQPDKYEDDRIFVYLKLGDDITFDKEVQSLHQSGHPLIQIHLNDKYELGSEFFRWELATAVAGYFLEINPFDQPNVEATKKLTKKMVTTFQDEGKLPETEPSLKTDTLSVFADKTVNSIEQALQNFFAHLSPGQSAKGRSYVAIQAFIQPEPETDKALQQFRTKIQKTYKVATTVGYGPRFLHSTGQLHKGDGGQGLFIQITGENPKDVPIPDKAGKEKSSISFGVLALAQALGDRQALLDAGRTVIRFHLTKDTVQGISLLKENIK
ncbi:MAG: glucose-6-phosphate isomerase [bacterium]